MKFTPVLSLYIARVYLGGFLIILGLLLGIVYLFDTVELLRRAGSRDGLPLGLVLQMGLFKLPDVGQTILPFAVLFSAMFTFWRLSRRSEMVVVRASGFSVWQFLTPVMGVAALIGVLQCAVVNPAGAVLMSKYEVMEQTFLSRGKSMVSLFEEGLWLRQFEEDDAGGYAIVHAERISLPAWELRQVMVLFYDAQDGLSKRIDAGSATLKDGEWRFQGALVHSPGTPVQSHASLTLPTRLTTRDIEDSFSSPTAQSFWKLPRYIRTLTETGFDATGLKIYFQSLLARPILFMAMVLLAAAVSLRPSRHQRTFPLIAAGVLCGFLVFFLSSFLQALGASQQIPVLLAAWAPGVVMLLMGLAVMLVLEDG